MQLGKRKADEPGDEDKRQKLADDDDEAGREEQRQIEKQRRIDELYHICDRVTRNKYSSIKCS